MRMLLALALCVVIADVTRGDSNSVGLLGANAIGLGLTGDGELIGQVEPGRPGKPGKDLPEWYHTQVQPTQVYAGGIVDSANSLFVQDEIGEHATQVAGVMIAKSTKFDNTPGDPTLIGIAPNAQLHSAAMSGARTNDNALAIAANQIARLSGMRAINISAGRALGPNETANGGARSSQFIDWSSTAHDVLYVIAGSEDSVPGGVPDDNYNGITVAASQTLNGGIAGRFVQSWPENENSEDAVGSRTSVDLLAPGFLIDLPSPGDGSETANGTSLAAPHVTGTVALLQEYASDRVELSTPRWDDLNARRHEVMKAILLNSADKLNGIHGSARDVVTKPASGAQKWTDLPVSSDQFTSLDQEIGAGHLNAASALTNFKPGEYEAGDVAPIGWDLGYVGAGLSNDYIIQGQISGYVAVTLAWDRTWFKTGDDDNYSEFDQFANPNLMDLDVYLLDANSDDILNPVAASTTTDDNLEHIFFNVGPGNYKIKVVHAFGNDDQEYGLAWWAGEAPTELEGDFNNDGNVDDDDLQTWKNGFGPTYDGSDFLAWQRNYGSGSSLTASEMLNQVGQLDFNPEQGVNSESQSEPLPIDNPLDVTGMQAVYDPLTGNVEFEGLTNIHGIGIMSNGAVDLNPNGAISAGDLLVANTEEIGWLFMSGITGGAFDGGAILEAGLSSELSNYFIGVVSKGSGKSVTPIPIVVGSNSYLPNFNPFAPGVAAVPEPSSLMLSVLGLAALYRRRNPRERITWLVVV